MATLSTKQRKRLSSSDFVFPAKAPGPGSYPIPDENHGRAALRFSAGKPEEGAVRAAVKRKFPGIVQAGSAARGTINALKRM